MSMKRSGMLERYKQMQQTVIRWHPSNFTNNSLRGMTGKGTKSDTQISKASTILFLKFK